jgi:hypothetical protein
LGKLRKSSGERRPILSKYLRLPKSSFNYEKKETLISILILALGLVFEYLHLMTDRTFLGIKFYLLGLIFIIIGSLGIWVYAIMPIINRRWGDDNTKSNECVTNSLLLAAGSWQLASLERAF